jgi:hypothetical protein
MSYSTVADGPLSASIWVLEPLAVYKVEGPPIAPIIISLAFEVVIPRVYGEAALDAAFGMPAAVSNGVSVFAPEIPKANKSAVGLPSFAVTVIMSLASGLAAIAYQVNK